MTGMMMLLGLNSQLLSTDVLTTPIDTLIVPALANWARIKGWGSGGGGASFDGGGTVNGGFGGGGGFSSVSVPVTAGETLYFSAAVGGSVASPFASGNGGNYSYVSRTNTPEGGGTVLLIAGAGGGGGEGAGTGNSGGVGGAGGGSTGQAGTSGSSGGTGGGGGTPSAGGAAGTGSKDGTAGSQFSLAHGAPNNASVGQVGGGGGGGWYGGGGAGQASDITGGGGGGGSSKTLATGVGAVLITGSGRTVANAGDPAYVAGHGNGGGHVNGGDPGQNGLLVIEWWLGLPR